MDSLNWELRGISHEDRVQRVVDGEFWQKTFSIVRRYGQYSRHVADWWSTDTHKLEVKIDGVEFRIHQSSYVMGGNYICITVRSPEYGKRTRSVLEMNECQDPKTASFRSQAYQHPENVITFPSEEEPGHNDHFYVETYEIGEWEYLLDDPKLIGEAIRRAKISLHRRLQEAVRKGNQDKPGFRRLIFDGRKLGIDTIKYEDMLEVLN